MSEVRCEHCGDSFLCRKHATEAKALETRYYCDELPPGLHQEAARHRALSAARDEVVRAAVAWHRMEHGATDALDAAVAAYEKLAKP